MMDNAAAAGPAELELPAAEWRGLLAAYCEGLGLAQIAVSADGTGIAILEGQRDASQPVGRPWWCRRGDADRVVTAVQAALQRRGSRDSTAACDDAAALQGACDAVTRTARRLGVALQSDQELAEEAAHVVARMESEFARLRQAGGLKSVNKAYQQQRTHAAARGEKFPPYGAWMRRYRENLVRELAATLRHF